MRAAYFAGLVYLSLANIPQTQAAINLVDNPGFEDGTPDPYVDEVPFWFEFDNTDPPPVFPLQPDYGVGAVRPHSGAQAAFFGTEAKSGIFQQIETVAGRDYLLTFQLMNDIDPQIGNNYSFDVRWQGISLSQSLPPISFPDPQYHSYSIGVTATTTGSELRFEFQQVFGGYFRLDDVSVTEVDSNAVPEPASLALWSLTALGAAAAFRRRRVAAG